MLLFVVEAVQLCKYSAQRTFFKWRQILDAERIDQRLKSRFISIFTHREDHGNLIVPTIVKRGARKKKVGRVGV